MIEWKEAKMLAYGHNNNNHCGIKSVIFWNFFYVLTKFIAIEYRYLYGIQIMYKT